MESAWEHRDTSGPGHGLSPEQLDLIYAKERDIDRDFWAFDRQNPHVYRLIVNLARTALRSGRTHYSIKTIMELIRWHHDVKLKGQQPFKINNDFTSRYARLVMSRECDLSEFFEVRKLRSRAK